jgi:2-aminoadipate transaminase
LVIPGSKFYAGSSGGFPNNEGHPRNRLRLTYSYPTEEQINEGVKRLGAVLRSMRN